MSRLNSTDRKRMRASRPRPVGYCEPTPAQRKRRRLQRRELLMKAKRLHKYYSRFRQRIGFKGPLIPLSFEQKEDAQRVCAIAAPEFFCILHITARMTSRITG
jgi:hypothetical protein